MYQGTIMIDPELLMSDFKGASLLAYGMDRKTKGIYKVKKP